MTIPQASSEAISEASAGEQVLDLTVIERIRQMENRGAARLLERLIATYQSTATKLLADGTAALGRDDSVGLRHAVHTLKSASANVGALTLARRCAEMEALGRDGHLPQAREAWPQLQGEFERVRAALQDLGCSVAT